jgi:hypothetical protein
MRYRIRWSIWMTLAGATTAVLVYLLTESIGWAIVGLLASGVVLNAIAESVTNGHLGKRRSR